MTARHSRSAGPLLGYAPYYAPPPRNGFGVAALCLAIPGMVFGLIPLTGFLAVVLGALALLFGLLGLARARRGLASNRAMSLVGSVLGACVLAAGIWGVVTVLIGQL